jgi:acetyl-CoA synthetase
VGVIIGMDPHKRSATIEVIDERGAALAKGRFGTDKVGYREMLGEGRRFADRCGRSRAVTASVSTSLTVWCMTAWPGIFQTIWGQRDRFVEIYYQRYCADEKSTDWHDWPYFAGDGAVQAADGYFRILGRVDDMINVAGHRLGTKELESASLTVDEIAEAAAVPVMDELRGRAVEMYVAPGITPSKDIEDKVIAAIDREIGKIARPKNVWIVPDMPKTRSGKIMRRVIAAVSNFTDVGDVTTLANPEVVDDIRHHVQGEKVARGEAPRALTPHEIDEIKAFGQAE